MTILQLLLNFTIKSSRPISEVEISHMKKIQPPKLAESSLKN